MPNPPPLSADQRAAALKKAAEVRTLRAELKEKLKMGSTSLDEVMTQARKSHRYFKNIGPSNDKYISDSLLIDMMLKEQTHIYTGGAGSCAGCGEGTALRMMLSLIHI